AERKRTGSKAWGQFSKNEAYVRRRASAAYSQIRQRRPPALPHRRRGAAFFFGSMPMNSFGRPLLQRASRLTSHYLRTQLSLSSVSLVGGFVFDAVTLKRVDMFWENFWVVVHLLVVAFCILWVNRAVNLYPQRESAAAKLDSWLIYLLQFF